MATTEDAGQTSMRELLALTDLDIASMNDETVKQMLMNLRGLKLLSYSNREIADLTTDEACRELLQLRNYHRGKVR
mgnify:CR=1 FL=1